MWIGVGCIEASLEAGVENERKIETLLLIKKASPSANEKLEDYERMLRNNINKAGYLDSFYQTELNKLSEEEKNKIISQVNEKLTDSQKRTIDWEKGDRMANAADRSWNGCDNLKDGYFSFMFYAAIVLNVLMLGNNSENYKKWILRLLLISSLLVLISSIVAFFKPLLLYSTVNFRRGIFNNSNHYGYYLCIISIMTLMLFIRDKNYYFKGIGLLTYLLSIPVLIINNTFGSYLGVTFSLAFIFIIAIIRLFQSKKIVEFVQVLIGCIYFICCSNIIATANVNANNAYYDDKGIYRMNSVTTLDLNLPTSIGDSLLKSVSGEVTPSDTDFATYRYTFASLNNELYTPFKKLDKLSSTIVQNNFNGLFKDLGIFSNYLDKENSENKEIENDAKDNLELANLNSGENISGNIILETSGNSNESNKEKVFNEKSGLSEEVSMIGSGRGEVWITCLKLIEQRPLFGWGLENLLNEFYSQYSVNEGRTHNLVLQLSGCTGPIGMFLYIIATIIIFMKLCFDYKMKKISNTQKIISIICFIITFIIGYTIGRKIIDSLLIGIIFGTILTSVVIMIYMLILNTNIRLRVSKWNAITHISMPIFVSYMISSLFGNSAFYTSPYFMIFLGLLLYEALNKEPAFVPAGTGNLDAIENKNLDVETPKAELENKENTNKADEKTETKKEEIKNDTTNNEVKKSNNNNSKSKKNKKKNKK